MSHNCSLCAMCLSLQQVLFKTPFCTFWAKQNPYIKLVTYWNSLILSYTRNLSLQFSSVAQSCPTLCNPMNCSTPGLPVHHQLPEFTQTHVHWVGDCKYQVSSPLSHIYPRNKTFSYLTTIQKITPQKNKKSLIPLNVASLHWNFLNDPSPPHTPISTQVQFVLCLLV